jgi:hypothetical protein
MFRDVTVEPLIYRTPEQRYNASLSGNGSPCKLGEVFDSGILNHNLLLISVNIRFQHHHRRPALMKNLSVQSSSGQV